MRSIRADDVTFAASSRSDGVELARTEIGLVCLVNATAPRWNSYSLLVIDATRQLVWTGHLGWRSPLFAWQFRRLLIRNGYPWVQLSRVGTKPGFVVYQSCQPEWTVSALRSLNLLSTKR